MLTKNSYFFNFVLYSQNFLSQSIAYKDDLGGDFYIHFFTLKGQRISSLKFAQNWESFFFFALKWNRYLFLDARIFLFSQFLVVEGRELISHGF